MPIEGHNVCGRASGLPVAPRAPVFDASTAGEAQTVAELQPYAESEATRDVTPPWRVLDNVDLGTGPHNGMIGALTYSAAAHASAAAG
jgi:hypothetical protein